MVSNSVASVVSIHCNLVEMKLIVFFGLMAVLVAVSASGK